MVAEKTGIDPLDVGISQLKGLSLCNINTICKEGNLTWYSFWQRLIEDYSNVPYTLDAMFAYSHLSQGAEEPTTQYLIRAKVLLECIHQTTKLSSIPGACWDNLYLIRGLKALYIRRRVAKSKTPGEWWKMSLTESIALPGQRRGTRSTLSQTFKSVSQTSREWVHKVSVCKYTRQNSSSTAYNGPKCRIPLALIFRSGDKQYSKQPCRDWGSYQCNWGPRKLVCYYCKGEHCIRDCKKFLKDKAKYQLKTADPAKV